MFKLSRYNYDLKLEDCIFVYNTLHRSFISLPQDVWENIRANDFEHLTKTEVSTLLDAGIIVHENIDESYLLRDIMYSSCLDSQKLTVLLSMTSLCNLSCPYCYQDCRKDQNIKTFISRKEIDVIAQFIEESHAKKVSIIYFGGEPTINQSTLVYAIEKLNAIVGKNVYNMLITNGYEISERLIATIKKIPNFNVQITFDGDRTLHDSLRVTSSGAPTFNIIWNNLSKLVDSIPGHVYVRVNVSKSDFLPYMKLVDELFALYKYRISISFDAIFDGQKKKNENNLEDSSRILELYDYISQLGYRSLPPIEFAPCSANTRNALTVDENLKVYSCPALIYKKSCGYISEDAKLRICDNEWYEKIYNKKPCSDTCLYGGLCYGGCEMKKYTCSKKELDKLLRYVILKKAKAYVKSGDFL